MMADIRALSTAVASSSIGSLQTAGQRVRFDDPTTFAHLRRTQVFTLSGFWSFTHVIHKNDVLLFAPNETGPLYQACVLNIQEQGAEAVFLLRWLDDVHAR